MSDDGRCTGCGSNVAADEGKCPYCGAAATTPVAAAIADPAAEREAVLAAIRAHPTFDALAREVPPVPALVSAIFVLPIVIGTVFVVVGVAMAIGGGLFARSVSESDAVGLAVAGFASIFAIIGIGVIVASVRTRKKLVGGPVRAVPAVVLAKRTEPGRSASSYYVTLGLEGAARHEFGTLDPVFRSAFEGDAGVAHCRGELLLAFRKVDA